MLSCSASLPLPAGRPPGARSRLGATAMFPRALFALLALALSGCFETAPLTEAASRALLPAAGPSQVQVLRNSITVAGPGGYCVDTEATDESDIEAFVLLVRCRATLRPSPVLSATITRLESDGNPETLRRLTAFLETMPGRAQLSRSGDPADVTVEQATFAEGVIWLLIHDEGNPRSFDETYWRAILPIAGRVVTLSVLAAAEHPFERDSGLSILRGFVMRMRAANPPG